MNTDDKRYDSITEQIIGCAYKWRTDCRYALLSNFGKRVAIKRLAGASLSQSVSIGAPSVQNNFLPQESLNDCDSD